MSEYEVTQVCGEEIEHLSGSVCELGNDAGQYTWQNCLECADRFGADLRLDLDDIRSHFLAYGAWDEDEVDNWTERECQALVIQEVAACMREMEHPSIQPGSCYTAPLRCCPSF